MKFTAFIAIFIFMLLGLFSCGDSAARADGMEDSANTVEELISTNAGVPGVYPALSPVGIHGNLRVIGNQLCDEKGEPVQLRGLFLRFLMEESKFINRSALAWCTEKWKIDVLRVPFLSEKWYGEPSYIGNTAYENYIKEAVQITEELGIYCIIDWHVLGDGNPNLHRKESRDFFKRMAFLYGAKKHVIYEICNEPNGAGVTWKGAIKPYADIIIPAIRAGNSNAIVIVGPSTWSQDVQAAADDPLKYGNIMYTIHFYAGSHKQALRGQVERASAKIALFATEWGTTDYSAQRGLNFEESGKWMDLLNKKKISWCNYALTDFHEDAALLRPGSKSNGGWMDDSLSLSGKFVVAQLTNR